jgi:primosomal protein N' (replication factor Y)
LLDPPPLPPALFKLCLWTAQYYQHSLGDTLSWALPVLLRQGELAEARQERFWSCRPARASMTRASPARRASAKPWRPWPSTPRRGPSAAEQADAEQRQPRPAAGQGLVQVEIRKHAPARATNTGWPSRNCRSTEQRAAFEAMRAGFDSFHAFLLAGVTGSGKTEVYLQLIRETLEAGKQALVLIPRSTSARRPWRASSNASTRIALLHSAVNDRERLEPGWRRATARPTSSSAPARRCSRR